MLNEVGWMVAVAALGAVLVLPLRSRYSADEFQLIQLSFLAHVGSSLAQIGVVWFYGSADMLMFHRFASELSAAARSDPGILTAIAQLLVKVDPELTTVYVPVAGETTGAMVAATAVACLLTNDSFYGANMLFAVVSFFGKVVLYEGIRIAAPDHHRWMRIGVFLVPSAVFWTSGILKEAWAVVGLAMAFLGAAMLVERRDRAGLIWILLGFLPMYGVKPYLIAAWGLGLLGWIYAKRAQGTGQLLRPAMVPVLILVALVFLQVLGRFIPRIALDNLAEESARMQMAGTSGKGSAYTLTSQISSSWTTQLAILPLAVFTGLFRPGLWEVANPLMLANALETTAFVVATLQVARNRAAIPGWLLRVPVLAFLVIFVVVLATATGFTSANLGTLSRYRMPLIPFFACGLLLLRRPAPTSG